MPELGLESGIGTAKFFELRMPSRTWNHGEGAAQKMLNLPGCNWTMVDAARE